MPEISSQRAEQLREQAARLHEQPHPEDPTRRRFGGPQPGSGRPKKPRPSELAAEAAHRHWDKLEEALLAGVEHGSGEARARAAERWLRLTVQDAAVELRARAEDRADDRFSAMTDDEVRREFASMLGEMVRTGELSPREVFGELAIGDVVDGVAVDLNPVS